MAEKEDFNLNDFLADHSITADDRLHSTGLFTSPENVLPVDIDIDSGRTTPIRVRTMKEYDQQIADLQKENFNLKLRIYFLEENAKKYHNGEEQDIYQINIELKVELESLKKDLVDKQELLIKASSALESIMVTHESEKMMFREKEMVKWRVDREELKSKIEMLEQLLELKDEDMKKLTNDLSAADAKMIKLSEDCELLKKENVHLKSDNDQLKELNEKIRVFNESLQQLQTAKDAATVDEVARMSSSPPPPPLLHHHAVPPSPPPSSPSLSSSSPKSHHLSSSLFVVVNNNGGGGGGGGGEGGGRRNSHHLELDSKDKIIEQLRCAVKVKEVIIEQLESENNEVKSKLKNLVIEGDDTAGCDRAKADKDVDDFILSQLRGGTLVGRKKKDNTGNGDKGNNDGEHNYDDGGDEEEEEDNTDGCREEKFLLESYVEKLSNKLKDREDVIKDQERTIQFYQNKLHQISNNNNSNVIAGAGNYGDGGEGLEEEGICSSWSNLCQPSAECVDGDVGDLHHHPLHHMKDHGEGDYADDDGDDDCEFESCQYRNERVMSDMSYLQIRNIDEILKAQRGDADVGDADAEANLEKMRRENEDLKERIWVMEMNFGEWREMEKRGFIEKYESLKKELEKILEEKDDLEVQNYEQRVHLDDVERTYQDLNNNNADLREKVNFLEGILAEKNKEFNGLVDRLKQAEDLANDFKGELLKKTDEVGKKSEELITSETKLNSLSLANDKLLLKITELEEAIEKLQSDIKVKCTNEESLTEKLSISDALGQQLNVLLKEGREINTNLTQKVEALTQKSNELMSSIVQKDAMIDKLNEHLHALKRDVDDQKENPVKVKSPDSSQLNRSELITENKVQKDFSSDERNNWFGRWNDLISDMEDDWMKEARDLKAWKEKLHSLNLQIESLACEKEVMEMRLGKELEEKNIEIESLKKKIQSMVKCTNEAPHALLDTSVKEKRLTYYTDKVVNNTVDCLSVEKSNMKKQSSSDLKMNSSTSESSTPGSNMRHDSNLSSLPDARNLEMVHNEKKLQLTPNASPPFFIMTSEDCKPLKHVELKEKFLENMSAILEVVFSKNWSTVVSVEEMLRWVEGKKGELLDHMRNSNLFDLYNHESRSIKEDTDVSEIRSGAKNSKFHLNFTSSHKNLSVKPGDHFKATSEDENVATLKKELEEVKRELMRANDIIDLLTEQIKLINEEMVETGSAKRKSKNDFNPQLIVKLVAEIKILKDRLAESSEAKPSSDVNDSAIVYPSYHLDSKVPIGSSLNKNPLKLSEYHTKLHLSNISAYDSKNNSKRISGVHGKDQSFNSSIKFNFTTHHEQSFKDLDSELKRLSLAPNMDSTRFDFANDNCEVSRKISGDSQLLADMLAVSENHCRLMRDRLKEIVVFLKKLLDNPDISSLLGLSGDVSKMSQCLNETASLLEDVSVWIEEGQDILNQTGNGELALNASLNRLSIVGRASLIGRSSLLDAVKEHVDGNDECSAAVALESNNLQQKQDDGETSSLSRQYQSEISALKEQIATMSKEKLELTEQCKQLEVEVSIAQQYRIEIEDLKDNISSLKCHIADVTEKNDRLKIEASNVKQYQSEIVLLKEKISSMNIHSVEVTENFEHIKMEALANQKSDDILSSTLIGCQQKINEVKTELDCLKKEHESLLLVKIQLEKEKNELEEARKTKNEQYSKLKSVLVELSTKLQQNEDEIENYHQRIKQLSEENMELKDRLKMLGSTIDELKNGKISLQEQLRTMESTIEQLKKEKTSLQEKLNAPPTATGKHSKAAKTIKGISQSEIIEQINKTRKVLAETTMNLDMVQQIRQKKQ